jgi:hypothetical protein
MRLRVRDLIKELADCNPDARVSIVAGDEDDNILDTYDFEIHAKDVDEYIELFVYTGDNEDIKKYRAVIKYDEGTFSLVTTASSARAAINKIMEAEGCPERSIIKLTLEDEL